ncbi:hypothetical protein ACFE04_027025 [Oxalis oulophora]
MCLHILILVQIKFLSLRHAISPVVSWLLCPFMVKLSLKLVHRAYKDSVSASRLFLFQLAHIALDNGQAQTRIDNEQQPQQNTNNNRRFTRVVRLISDRVRPLLMMVRISPTQQSEEFNNYNLHTLSMISL